MTRTQESYYWYIYTTSSRKSTRLPFLAPIKSATEYKSGSIAKCILWGTPARGEAHSGFSAGQKGRRVLVLVWNASGSTSHDLCDRLLDNRAPTYRTPLAAITSAALTTRRAHQLRLHHQRETQQAGSKPVLPKRCTSAVLYHRMSDHSYHARKDIYNSRARRNKAHLPSRFFSSTRAPGAHLFSEGKSIVCRSKRSCFRRDRTRRRDCRASTTTAVRQKRHVTDTCAWLRPTLATGLPLTRANAHLVA